MSDPVTADPWSGLKQWTAARIALGRAGTSLPTAPLLDFQLAHARARDAIFRPCSFEGLAERSTAWGLGYQEVSSRARDRQEYLRRPDLGRQLADGEGERLNQVARPCDLVLIVADGLSSLAVDRQAGPLLDGLVPRLREAGLRLAPLVLGRQARVAFSDPVGEALKAPLAIILIGERPGLSAPDSLGAYLTWNPKPGRQNAERNCVSNIRPEGLSYEAATQTLFALIQGARILGESGIGLKEDSWLESRP